MDTKVLIVDDNAADRHLAEAIVCSGLGWKVLQADNGTTALARLERDRPHIVLTDLQMPDMDGLELVDIIRTRFPYIPVLLMTAVGSEDLAIQALQRGAASYVPKRNLDHDLTETLERVLVLARAEHSQQQLFERLTKIAFHYSLDNDPALVPILVGQLQQYHLHLNLCDASGKIRVGVALEEALLNALYHGNLEVDSELRQDGDEPFYRLVEERRRQSPYRERRIQVLAELSRSEARYVITDEGKGFDHAQLADPADPANLVKSSGRGVMLIRTLMDEATYNDKGNQLTLVKRRR